MTDQEINAAIAAASGWKWDFTQFNEVYWMDPKGSIQKEPPNFCADLNAMHEAEKTLPEKQVPFYLTKLLQVRYRSGADHGMMACMQDNLAFATARQRAEAFLRTLNLWKD